MTISLPRPRTVALLLAAIVAAFALFLASAPSTASAHDQLVSADPADGAVLDTAPEQITLTYSAEVLTDAGATLVEATDADGASVVDGEPVVDGVTVVQPLLPDTAGEILVEWKVVSSDGHPISGEFRFTVDAPAPTPTETPTATPTATASATPSETPTASETPAPAPAADDAAPVWPWIVGAIVVVALVAGVTYLLVSRSRRNKALGGGPSGGSGAGAGR